MAGVSAWAVVEDFEIDVLEVVLTCCVDGVVVLGEAGNCVCFSSASWAVSQGGVTTNTRSEAMSVTRSKTFRVVLGACSGGGSGGWLISREFCRELSNGEAPTY